MGNSPRQQVKKKGAYWFVYYSICVKGVGMMCLWGEGSREQRTSLFCFILFHTVCILFYAYFNFLFFKCLLELDSPLKVCSLCSLNHLNKNLESFRYEYMCIIYIVHTMKSVQTVTVVISGERDWGVERCFGDQLSRFASD